MTDIIIIGGGLIGLSIALELKLQQKDLSITILNRNFEEGATQAAAGMLAPRAEQLTHQGMLNLCLKSLELYPHWINKIESLTGLNTGYYPCGILAPVYSENQPQQKDGIWLTPEAIKDYQPNLSEEVLGAWWYADEGQIDNRQLAKVLHQAVINLGIEIKEGVTVESLPKINGKIQYAKTNLGDFSANTYILANGAWSSPLFPIPVTPVKGQMLSLQMPREENNPFPIQRVLYGENIYLVPRLDGRLIVGATVEKTGWKAGNTPEGIETLLREAKRLYPPLSEWSIDQIWYGYRPDTPDQLPILGPCPCENLILATGHYRNGILLAPITAQLIQQFILSQETSPLLQAFRWDRSKPIPISPKPMTPLTLPTPQPPTLDNSQDQLIIAGRKFTSRLMTGTGKYASLAIMQDCIKKSQCEIVTVAVRRVQSKAEGHEGLAQAIDWSKIWMLPNTAGCTNAEEAVRVARLGREMAKLLGQEDNNFVKLEVIPDTKYLLPDPIETLKAAEQLIKEGFAVLPYINADPLLAKRLEEAGCATVMPLGSPIGSGQGIKNTANIAIIIEQAKIPVVVDAGIGTPSEACYAMELGADALLVNSAIALAQNAPQMASAMALGCQAGRLAYLAGRIPIKAYASASSPLTGTINS